MKYHVSDERWAYPTSGAYLLSLAGFFLSCSSVAADEPPFRLIAIPSETRRKATADTEPESPANAKQGEPLDQKTLRDIFRRVPALTIPKETSEAIRLPETGKLRPRDSSEEGPKKSGNKTQSEKASESSDLKIRRFSPQGDTEIVDHILISFSQPMIALGAQQIPLEEPPAKVDPEISGTWRWIDTRTLLFEPDGPYIHRHLPMATDYRVEVPRGTSSLSGAKLEKTKSFEFSTGAPRMVRFHPGKYHWVSADVPIVLVFNQAVDPDSVFERVKAVGRGKEIPLRVATREEIEDSPSIRSRERDRAYERYSADPQKGPVLTETREGYRVILMPKEKFPAEVTVTLGAGVRSLVGPRVSQASASFQFNTHARDDEEIDQFLVTSHRHKLERGRGRVLVFHFNSPLDRSFARKTEIRIQPALTPDRITFSWWTLNIDLGEVDVKEIEVTLPADLRDTKERTLGKEVTRVFRIERETPGLYFAGRWKALLDPGRPAGLSFHTVNLRAIEYTLRKVSPEDWPAFRKYHHWSEKKRFGELVGDAPELPGELVGDAPELPGEIVYSDRHQARGKFNTMVENRLDVAPAFPDGVGHAILLARGIPDPPEKPPQTEEEKANALRVNHESHVIWLERSFISVAALWDGEELRAWTTNINSREALEGVEVSLYPAEKKDVTAADGLATLKLRPFERQAQLLIARHGSDTAFLAPNPNAESPGWFLAERNDQLRASVMLDRSLYRPGETVYVKGWIRKIGLSKGGDIEWPEIREIEYVVEGSEREYERHRAKVSAVGSFSASFKIPETANWLTLVVKNPDGDKEGDLASEYIPIASFRRPDFELRSGKTSGPCIAGEPVDIHVRATYLTAGPLANAKVRWIVSSSPTQLTVPRWSEFTFGAWSPWWGDVDEEFHDASANYQSELSGKTDADGVHRFRLVTPELRMPLAVKSLATVLDLNRSEQTVEQRLVVLPGRRLIGIRAPETFGTANEKASLEFIVTGPDGEAIPGVPVQCRLFRREWIEEDGKRTAKEMSVASFEFESAATAVPESWTPKQGGTYVVRASVLDDRGRRAESSLLLWIAGSDRWSQRTPHLERLEFIPDREKYAVGDTARILMKSPYHPARGIFSILREGVISTETFTMEGSDHVFEISIAESYLPGITLHVDLIASIPRRPHTLDGALSKTEPQRMVGSFDLDLSLDSRKLKVRATARKTTLRPGEETTIDILVVDAKGHPVPDAEVCITAVDDAVFALAGQVIPDALAQFHPDRWMGVSLRWNIFKYFEPSVSEARQIVDRDYYQVPDLALRAPDDPNAIKAVKFTSAKLDAGAQKGPKLRLRRDFRATPFFSPGVMTDAEGKASVNILFPGNLTRYRVSAVAATRRQFGHGRTFVTAKQPLMIRPSPPRFVRRGDRFEMTLLLENASEDDLSVEFALRARGIRWLDGGGEFDSPLIGRRIFIAALDRREFRFPALASEARSVVLQAAAISKHSSDAAEVQFSIREPIPIETVAVYGQLGPGEDHEHIEQKLVRPPGSIPDRGSLEIEFSASRVQGLAESFRYLLDYPYGCAEQISSRLIAMCLLLDKLPSLGSANFPDASELRLRIDREVKDLQRFQTHDGGWAYWPRGYSDPYLSAHVVHALERAKRAGFSIHQGSIDKWIVYFRKGLRRYPSPPGGIKVRSMTDEEAREPENLIIHAYSLYAASLGSNPESEEGRAARRETRDWMEKVDIARLPASAAAWALTVLGSEDDSATVAKKLLLHLNRNVKETARSAHLENSSSSSWNFVLPSSLRAHSLFLEALLAYDPENYLVAKLATGLLDRRRRGHWGTTQENALALTAASLYLSREEPRTPEFDASAWVGDRLIFEREFRDGKNTPTRFRLPWQFTSGWKDRDLLTISKDGPGTLFYEARMNYALRAADRPAVYAGFELSRNYEYSDSNKVMERDPAGILNVDAGEPIRVRIFLFTPDERRHVALVDPFPAGFEGARESFHIWRRTRKNASGKLRRLPASSHRFRDDRAEVFAGLLPRGIYTYDYVIRATTPGEFIAPPTRAEAMYEPEVYGLSTASRVRVSAR